ncbi:MAG: OmpA family protein [Bradymonadales bacterium]|nr:OmpA family protein [Bradymonadales bacterium]
MRNGQWLSGFLGILVLSLVGGSAAAQQQFDVQSFHPLPSQQINYFGVASARVMRHTDFELGLLLHFADDPLVLVYGEDDTRLASVVSYQLTADLMAAVGLLDWFELGVAVPLILMQEGEDTTIVQDAPDAGFGIGDLRFVPRFQLFSTERLQRSGGFTLGLMSNIWVPVGDRDRYQGEGFRFEPRLVFDLALGKRARMSANLGYIYREETEFLNLEVDDSFTAGLAARIALIDWIDLVPELSAAIPVLAEEIDLEEVPMEGRLGVKMVPTPGLLVQAGAGMGLIEGFSSPDWRLFLGVSYSPPENPDRDGDGYLNDEDDCPDDPEDFDGFEDEDGCPDPDNDRDGILDSNDRCPNEPEDRDGFEDEDGCPDLDNDGDGIPDTHDTCPNEAEDFDAFQDTDGCPDPDNDTDGFCDPWVSENNLSERFLVVCQGVDLCPDDPETFNDYEDEDGCPDVPMIECDRIVLEETVHFDSDSDVIQERSYRMLNDVAELLNRRLDIRLVRVEGHTDSRSSEEYNLDLSRRRAESVRQYLVGRGVDAGRLTSVGYGESRPIASNATEEGQAQNRRVQLTILQQDGCDDIRPPY